MAKTIVLGAGMVGVSTALALQDRGDDVLLVDRKGIGRETSYGNAGAIQTEAVEPYAFPRQFGTLMNVALHRDNAVNWHLKAMPEVASPLLRYWANSAPKRHGEISKSFAEIVARADEFHAPLIAASASADLVERRGYYVLFRTEQPRDAAFRLAEAVQQRWNVPTAMIDGAGMKLVEPGLKIDPVGALHYGNVWTCRSPGGLTAAYGRLFVSRGGSFAYGDAQSLTQTETGWQLRTESGVETAERVVLALGAWSTQLTKRLGYRFPLFRKRGYHRHFNAPHGPAHPMFDAESATFLSPMNQGLRLCTGAEFTAFDAAIDWRQIRYAERSARELFDIGTPIEAEPWFGHRPCMPDMLPVLGEAANHKGLWFHFGHAHQGFTAGPASAHILAELMFGNVLPVAQSLSPQRFK